MVAFFGDDVVTEIDAFVANINSRTGDQLTNFVLAFSTERTNEIS
jgi:hypothetical protein